MSSPWDARSAKDGEATRSLSRTRRAGTGSDRARVYGTVVKLRDAPTDPGRTLTPPQDRFHCAFLRPSRVEIRKQNSASASAQTNLFHDTLFLKLLKLLTPVAYKTFRSTQLPCRVDAPRTNSSARSCGRSRYLEKRGTDRTADGPQRVRRSVFTEPMELCLSRLSK